MSGYTKVFSRAARSAGLSDDQFRRLIANGVAKINYYTALSDSAAKQINENTKKGSGGGYTGLVKNIRSRKASVRLRDRSHIVLMAADGVPNYRIAKRLKLDINPVGR